MSALYGQLLKHERDQIREDERNPAVTSASFKEHLAYLWDWQGYEAAQGTSSEQIAARIAAHSQLYPDWSLEQVVTALAIENVAGGLNQDLGFARRLIRDDPAELARGVCLGARYEWLQRKQTEQIGMGMADDDPFVAQLALPVMDTELIRRAVDAPVLEQDPSRALLYQGIAAAYHRDPGALGAVVERFNKRKVHRAYLGMRGVLTGISKDDPEEVAAGLNEILDDENRCRKRKEGRIISMEAHQFYRLAEWVSPSLVSRFDVRQGLPWDADFHAYLHTHPDPLSGLDLSDISPILHDALIHLKMPGWWRAIDEPEFPGDACRIILTDLGPNPGKVRNMIALWAQMRNWPLPDCDRLPAVVVPESQRVAACGMSRELRGIGAAARFEAIAGRSGGA